MELWETKIDNLGVHIIIYRELGQVIHNDPIDCSDLLRVRVNHSTPRQRPTCNREPRGDSRIQEDQMRHQKQIQKKVNGNRRTSSVFLRDPLQVLYETPLPSTRKGPLYNAFPYPTKISPESIAVFLATHTKPGDVILDAFAGSGTTGLATLLCDKPNEDTKRLAAELGVKPVWGPRQAQLYELSVLGAFVSQTMCAPPDPLQFEAAATKLINAAENLLGNIYTAKDPDGNVGRIRYAIWSDVLLCPHCNRESSFYEVGMKHKPLHFVELGVCPHCKRRTPIGEFKRAEERTFDPLIKKLVVGKKRRLAMICGETNGKTWQRPSNSNDLTVFKNACRAPLPQCVPVMEVVWGDLQRNGYHKGVSHIHHFYTRRNLLAVATLWDQIETFNPKLQDALRLLVLGYNASHSTLMTRVVVKNGQKGFVVTGAQSGILYISGLPVEKNIFKGLHRKIQVFKKAFAMVHGSKSHVQVVNKSSTSLRLKSESVDYVFTDPPFGDYIPYAELNQINEAWLGQCTKRTEEIIVSVAQGKDVRTYGKMMGKVFMELARVLKERGLITLVFHSAKATVWDAMMESYTAAGLSVKASSVLDKLQASFKQVVSDVAVKNDPVFLLAKGKSPSIIKLPHFAGSEQIVREILSRVEFREQSSKERTVERLYSRYVSRCLEVGVAVSMNANTFYDRMRAHHGIR